MVNIVVNYGRFYMGDLADAWEPGYIISAPTSSHFEMIDPLTGRKLEFTGMNFEDSAPGKAPTIGVIEGISYYNHDGSLAWKMSKLHISVAELQKAAESSTYATPKALETFFSQTGFSVDRGVDFHGSVGNDIFNGGYGTDIIRGGAGADIISGGFERDIMSGGGRDSANPRDIDVLTYANETGGDEITVDISRGTVIDTNGFTDRISGFEMYIGTAVDDTFIAGDKNTFHGFVGGAGNDIFRGGKGHYDAVFYDQLNTGAVTITASAGGLSAVGQGIGTDQLLKIDIVVGSAANDFIEGTGANETFSGGNGIDTLIGGAGNDTIDFSYEKGTFGAVTNLSMAIAIDTYHSGLGTSSAYVEHITDFENVTGSANDDYITGSNDANRLRGNAGEDVLRGLGGRDIINGGDGNDWIVGGGGRDALTGGNGSDVFFFDKGALSTNARQADVIRDFDVSENDVVDLSYIDANTGKAGDQAFTFIGTHAFSGKAGELRIVYQGGDTWIYGSIDTDKQFELAIHLDGKIKLTAADFDL